MSAIKEDLCQFRNQLKQGSLQTAYRAILSYMMNLRRHYQHSAPDLTVTSLYQGYLDMTYFALVTPALKEHGLKIAIVFNYDTFNFEAWLAAKNRKVQRQYWEMLKGLEWPEGYRVPTPAVGIDAIVECDLGSGHDLVDPEALTNTIESDIAVFIRTVGNQI